MSKEDISKITFVKRIKGTKDHWRRSVSVPKHIAQTHGLESKQKVIVTITNRLSEYLSYYKVFETEFEGRIKKCGMEGLIIYVPRPVSEGCPLHREQKVKVTLMKIE